MQKNSIFAAKTIFFADEQIHQEFKDVYTGLRGKTAEGKGAQIDLLLDSKASRTDYVCEMKFTMGKYTISADYEIDLNTKMDAFSESKMHTKTHSIQLVMVTTMGIAQGEHAGVVNQSIVMDDLFRIG